MRQSSSFGIFLVFIQLLLLIYDFYKTQIFNALTTQKITKINENKPIRNRRSLISAASSTIDYSGQYEILRFYKHLPVSRYWTFHDVTLVTQCSVNHLHYLVQLTSHWSGRVSCAVFIPDMDGSYAAWAVDALRLCYPGLMRRVDFHFVYPQNHPADFTKAFLDENYNGFLEDGCAGVLQNIENYIR